MVFAWLVGWEEIKVAWSKKLMILMVSLRVIQLFELFGIQTIQGLISRIRCLNDHPAEYSALFALKRL
jgi:hypothetical protein